MTGKDWVREYLMEVNAYGQVLTLEQEQHWLQYGVNPVNPGASNPIPSGSPGHNYISPTVPRHANVNPATLTDTAYKCGNPGGKISRRTGNYSLPLSTWDWSTFSSDLSSLPKYLEYRYVANGGSNCNDDTGCTAPELCGLSAAKLSASNPTLQKTCGTLKGYWTADQVCGVDPSFNDFYCPLLYNLYGCVGGTVSCYSAGASSNCCGCADWWTVSSVMTVPGGTDTTNGYPLGTEYCVNKNPKWQSNVQPGLQPYKKMAPTVYTFPFDDKSSTFVCNNAGSSSPTKPLDYFIIFCPDTTAPTGPISAVANNAYRTIRFVNKCTFEVWPAVAGGSAFNKATIGLTAGQVTSCSTDADCVTGTKCITTGAIQQCFWVNPTPITSVYKLDASGGTTTTVDFHIPITSDTVSGVTDIVWSGIMTGRTACTSSTSPCGTSDCNNVSPYGGACTPGVGFIQPGAQGEFTFQQDTDFYDVEVINGINGVASGSSFTFLSIEIYPDVAS